MKRTCGVHKLSEKEDPSLIETTTIAPPLHGKTRADNPTSVPELETFQFLLSISKSKGFYGNLADSLCRDENFAEPKDAHCWNGERIGE